MAVHGIEFIVGFAAEVEDIEDRVDDMYSCLRSNFALVSVDLALDIEKGQIHLLLGVSTPDAISAEQERLAVEIAGEAVKRALEQSGLVEPEVALPPSARVSEFAA